MTRYLFTDSSHDIELARLRALEASLDPITTRHLEQIGVSAGWTCLEVGVGAGSIATWLAQRVGTSGAVVATDTDPRFMTDIALPNLTVHRHDITSDPLEANEYELVHVRCLLTHLNSREQALRVLARACRPGGYLIVEEPDLGDPAKYFHSIRSQGDHAGAFARVMTQLTLMAERSGVDFTFGRHLPELMADLGFIDLVGDRHAQVLRGGEMPCAFYTNSIRLLADRLPTVSDVTEQDVIAAIESTTKPSFWTYGLPVVTVRGRKPLDAASHA